MEQGLSNIQELVELLLANGFMAGVKPVILVDVEPNPVRADAD